MTYINKVTADNTVQTVDNTFVTTDRINNTTITKTRDIIRVITTNTTKENTPK